MIVDINLMAENVIQVKSGIKISANMNVKKTIKHQVCKKDYAWNVINISDYLKTCTCVKSIIRDLVITCDEIVDTPETMSINSNNKKAAFKMGYYILHTFSLATIKICY